MVSAVQKVKVNELKVSLLKGHPFEECVIFWKWLEEDGDLRYDSPFDIDAEKLHKYLGVKQDFKKWFKSAVNEWGYSESDSDFHPMHSKKSKRRTNYVLSLNMAQELAFLEGSPEGNEARKKIRELKRAELNWQLRKKRREGFLLLTHPTRREHFLRTLSVFLNLDTYDARDDLEYMVKQKEVTERGEQEQRIVNELLFTKEAIKRVNMREWM